MSTASTQESTLKAILQDLKQFEENFPDMKSTTNSCALPPLHQLQSSSYLAHSFPQVEWNENVVHFDSCPVRHFPPPCDDNFHQEDAIGQNLNETFNHDNFTMTLRQQHFHATPSNCEKTDPSSSSMLENKKKFLPLIFSQEQFKFNYSRQKEELIQGNEISSCDKECSNNEDEEEEDNEEGNLANQTFVGEKPVNLDCGDSAATTNSCLGSVELKDETGNTKNVKEEKKIPSKRDAEKHVKNGGRIYPWMKRMHQNGQGRFLQEILLAYLAQLIF